MRDPELWGEGGRNGGVGGRDVVLTGPDVSSDTLSMLGFQI